MATKSQNQLILDYLQEGKTITSLEALNKFGCARLASRISELRKQGVNIETQTIFSVRKPSLFGKLRGEKSKTIYYAQYKLA